MLIGIISDTHMPQRWPALPEAVGRLFGGVDLILHAGDVGELWVLDELARFAPVVGVHGNDDTVEAQRELPYQQLLALEGRRLLLWHSHYEDRAQELASRVDDWHPGLRRLAARAQRAGAEVAVFGHTHVPMLLEYEGVLLVNGGAIASGNFVTRQTRQSVALMRLEAGRAPQVRHVDLAAPEETFEPWVELEAGFEAALGRYQESLLAPALRERLGGLRPDMFEDVERVLAAVTPLARACWAGEREWITEEVLMGVLGAEDRARLGELMEGEG